MNARDLLIGALLFAIGFGECIAFTVVGYDAHRSAAYLLPFIATGAAFLVIGGRFVRALWRRLPA